MTATSQRFGSLRGDLIFVPSLFRFVALDRFAEKKASRCCRGFVLAGLQG
jgi:hypothetical protein